MAQRFEKKVNSWVDVDVLTTVPDYDYPYNVLLIFDKAPVDVLIKDFVLSFCDA